MKKFSTNKTIFILNYFWVSLLVLFFMNCDKTRCYGETKHKQGDGYQQFVSKKGFFSASFPKEWSHKKNSSKNIVFSVVNSKGNVGINVVYKNDLKYNKSIKELTTLNDLISGYTDLGWNFELINSGETTFWDEDALFLKIIRKLSHMNSDIYLILWQLCFTHQNDSYIITFSAAETSHHGVISEFDQHEQYFEYFLATFRLDDWKRKK